MDARGDGFVGREIGGHRLERLIARGAIGAVFAATHVDSGEPRALKLVPIAPADRAAGGDDAAARFEREARASMRLRHPHIVAVHACGTEGGWGWMAMEALAGRDLERYTTPARRLPEPVVLRIGERLALALAHAHAQGVVHRDVKPGNVIVDWAADRVTLTDFGLARLADAERTRSGVVLGSPAYMAPELLAGQAATAASDHYALGVLLWQLLAGRLPFDDSNLGDLLRRVAQEPTPPLPDAVGPTVSQARGRVQALLATLMDKRPDARQPRGDALAARLGELRVAWEAEASAAGTNGAADPSGHRV